MQYGRSPQKLLGDPEMHPTPATQHRRHPHRARETPGSLPASASPEKGNGSSWTADVFMMRSARSSAIDHGCDAPLKPGRSCDANHCCGCTRPPASADKPCTRLPRSSAAMRRAPAAAYHRALKDLRALQAERIPKLPNEPNRHPKQLEKQLKTEGSVLNAKPQTGRQTEARGCQPLLAARPLCEPRAQRRVRQRGNRQRPPKAANSSHMLS